MISPSTFKARRVSSQRVAVAAIVALAGGVVRPSYPPQRRPGGHVVKLLVADEGIVSVDPPKWMEQCRSGDRAGEARWRATHLASRYIAFRITPALHGQTVLLERATTGRTSQNKPAPRGD
jgi:hypothetical protein